MATQAKIVMIMTNGDIIGGGNENGDSWRLLIWWLNDYNADCSHLRGGPFDGEFGSFFGVVNAFLKLFYYASQTKVGNLDHVVIAHQNVSSRQITMNVIL